MRPIGQVSQFIPILQIYIFICRTLEKFGLKKKSGSGPYQDYSSSSEEEDLLLSRP